MASQRLNICISYHNYNFAPSRLESALFSHCAEQKLRDTNQTLTPIDGKIVDVSSLEDEALIFRGS